jgi:hypothetical protein
MPHPSPHTRARAPSSPFSRICVHVWSQLLADSDDDEAAHPAGASALSAPVADDVDASAYTPFSPPAPPAALSPSPSEPTPSPADDASQTAAAASVDGLAALMSAAGLEERLGSAGAWCVQHGWASVAHLRSGGACAADGLVAHLRLKADGTRAKRLKKELKRDVWSWDPHALAAKAAASPA